MSEWNRGGRDDEARRRQFESEQRDWARRERRQGYGGEREQRSFHGGGGDYAQGSTGQGYGYGRDQNQGVSGYAQSGQGYGGQAYGQGYGGAGHPGQSYGSGESYGQSGQDFGRESYGERSYGGQSRGGGLSYGGQDYGPSRSDRDWSRQRHSQGGGAQQFGDPNEEVRRVTDGDDGRHGMMRMFGGGMSGGQHRGRGPKNYTRSDERIREDVNDRLSDDAWLDASEIDVQVDKCEVTLTGTVDSREDRRRAEDLAEQVSGVKHVQNNIRVQQQGSGGSASSMQAGDGAGSTGVGDRSSLASGTTSTGGTVGKAN